MAAPAGGSYYERLYGGPGSKQCSFVDREDSQTGAAQFRETHDYLSETIGFLVDVTLHNNQSF